MPKQELTQFFHPWLQIGRATYERDRRHCLAGPVVDRRSERESGSRKSNVGRDARSLNLFILTEERIDLIRFLRAATA